MKPHCTIWLVLLANCALAADAPGPLTQKMPITAMTMAKPMAGIGTLQHPVTTASPLAQQYYNQGLCLLHSFWYYESARAFETATLHDPNCAMAFWGLARALDSLGRSTEGKRALEKANELAKYASPREKLFLQARTLQQQGASTAAQVRRLLNDIIALYPTDEEAWMLRAATESDGTAAQIADYQAVLRLNPNHHGAHHHLIHAYEGYGRPALGWPHGEGYARSAPGTPHSWHMWAHLAMRLSRWEVATANCLKATALEREWFAVLGTRMTDYSLSSHHFDICFRALMHDGRYLEARKLAQEVYQAGSKGAIQFDKGRLHTLERDWEEVLRVGEDYKKSNNRNDGMYFIALALIGKGELVQAEAECKTLEEALKNPRHYRVLETRGLLLCATGRADEGLKLLQEAAQKSQNDYGLHAYGGGAYFMETWGWAALAAQRFDDAEEAFYEALAHDTASARAAIGLQALMETRGRREEAQRYAQLAREFWRNADARLLDNELQRARSCANSVRVAQGVK